MRIKHVLKKHYMEVVYIKTISKKIRMILFQHNINYKKVNLSIKWDNNI